MGHSPCFSFPGIFQPSAPSMGLTSCLEIFCDFPNRHPGILVQKACQVNRHIFLGDREFLTPYSRRLDGQSSTDIWPRKKVLWLSSFRSLAHTSHLEFPSVLHRSQNRTQVKNSFWKEERSSVIKSWNTALKKKTQKTKNTTQYIGCILPLLWMPGNFLPINPI